MIGLIINSRPIIKAITAAIMLAYIRTRSNTDKGQGGDTGVLEGIVKNSLGNVWTV
jgi:hypothetical protein